MAKTVAYVPDPEAAVASVSWARFAVAKAAALDGVEPETTEYYCTSPRAGTETVDAVKAVLAGENAVVEPLPAIDATTVAMERARAARADFLVSCLSGLPHELAVDTARRLLKTAPCATFVALWGDRPPEDIRRVLAIVSDSAHDPFVFVMARALADVEGGHLTLARIEDDVGGGAQAVGERELARFLHEASASDDDSIETKVVVDNHPVRGVTRCFDGHDLVLVPSSNLDLVRTLQGVLSGAVVGLVKRKPPLKRRSLPDWIPQVNPADYAELAQNLRQGSRWNADFIVMLGLASAIASLGLIQDSPAVVIGSMLLAPLMTPMLGFGLGLAQANGRMARLSGRAIVQGFVLTLLVSFGMGFLSFRETLSPEVLSRGSPNILDLGIALFAGMAASFALARPSITGAVAGVAIATALVPPLCACGISLEHGNLLNAFGAAVLFATNLLAIVVASSLTFMAMGITVPHAFSRARKLARHGMGALVFLLLVLCLPLGWALKRQLEEGRAMPIAYPVTRALSRALHERVHRDEGVRIMLLGRSSVGKGVGVWLATDEDVSKEYRDELRAIIREQMEEPDLPIFVIAVRSAMDD